MTRLHARLALPVLLASLAAGCPGPGSSFGIGPNVSVSGDISLVEGAGGLELAFTHSVGATMCPQHIETLRFDNDRAGPVTITITGGGAAIEADPQTITVGPHESGEVEIRFTCSMASDVNETLTIDVVDDEGNSVGSPTTVVVRGTVS